MAFSKMLQSFNHFPVILLGLLPFILGSCSTSRSVNTDLVVTPGEHRIGSVIDSDILVPDGSTLEADYLSGNRIFVASGGTLTGLSKGAQKTTVYAETGALLPTARNSQFVIVERVDDAAEAYDSRFQKLLPAGTPRQNSAGYTTGGAYYGGGAFVGGGFFGKRRFGRRSFRGSSGRFSRPVSVRPSGFRSRN